jgi:hypothetical protein
MSRQILNGWKEIANYFERGVRTAQRWEALLGMPVHRPALKDRSAVVAFTDELDRWISRAEPNTVAVDGEGSEEALAQVRDNMITLAWHTSELVSQTRALREQLRRSLEIHRDRIASRMHSGLAAASSQSTGAMLHFRPRNNLGRRLLIP